MKQQTGQLQYTVIDAHYVMYIITLTPL